jgi:hypothetical protein
MNLREVGWGGMDWIDLAQDRDQWSEHNNKLLCSINFWEVLGVAAQLAASQEWLSSMDLVRWFVWLAKKGYCGPRFRGT